MLKCIKNNLELIVIFGQHLDRKKKYVELGKENGLVALLLWIVW